MASFDALATARELEGAGMERRQAEAVAAACREAAGADRAELATKADLETKLSALETRLTWRMVGVVAGVNGAFAALIVALLVAVLDRLP